MSIAKEITAWLKVQGVDFVIYIDISDLPPKQNKGYPSAILFGVKFSPEYIRKVSKSADYV